MQKVKTKIHRYMIGFEKDIDEIAKDIIRDILREWLQTAKLYSPINTGDYEQWHQTSWPKKEWSKRVWVLFNNIEYAKKVEEWFREKPVNWHRRNLWDIYHSKGADVYEKTRASLENKLETIVLNNIIDKIW